MLLDIRWLPASEATSSHIARSTSRFFSSTSATAASASRGMRHTPAACSAHRSPTGCIEIRSRCASGSSIGALRATLPGPTSNSNALSVIPTSNTRVASPPPSPADGRMYHDWYGSSSQRSKTTAKAPSPTVLNERRPSTISVLRILLLLHCCCASFQTATWTHDAVETSLTSCVSARDYNFGSGTCGS
jgi:hypothetical protein